MRLVARVKIQDRSSRDCNECYNETAVTITRIKIQGKQEGTSAFLREHDSRAKAGIAQLAVRGNLTAAAKTIAARAMK